jgi:hypothetical protein
VVFSPFSTRLIAPSEDGAILSSALIFVFALVLRPGCVPFTAIALSGRSAVTIGWSILWRGVLRRRVGVLAGIAGLRLRGLPGRALFPPCGRITLLSTAIVALSASALIPLSFVKSREGVAVNFAGRLEPASLLEGDDCLARTRAKNTVDLTDLKALALKLGLKSPVPPRK